MTSLSDSKFFGMGNNYAHGWNKKLCFEARDSLYDCVEAQPNGNKLRCPDQLYAYEMWCPTEVRRAQTARRSKQLIDESMYDADMVAQLNFSKQNLQTGFKNMYV